MPSRGSYQVAPGVDPTPPPAAAAAPISAPAAKRYVDPEKGQLPRSDTSFRDCLLSMTLMLLILLVIVAIVVLVAQPWGRNSGDASGSQAHNGRTSKQTGKRLDHDADENRGPVSSSTASTTSTTSTTTTHPNTHFFPTAHKSGTTTKPMTTTPKQFERIPQERPSPDYSEDDETSTSSHSTSMTPSTDDQVEGDDGYQTNNVNTTESPNEDVPQLITEELPLTTDYDFELAVANNGPTTTEEGVSTKDDADITTETEYVEEEPSGTSRREGKSAKLLVTDIAETTVESDSATVTSGTTAQVVDDIVETTLSPEDAEMTLLPGDAEATVTPTDEKPKECSSAACKKQAARMLGLMDHTTEPCQDFYQHACGGLRANALLAEDDAVADAVARIDGELDKVDNNTASVAHRTFRRFYDLCIEDVGDKDKRIGKFSTSARNAVENIGKLYTNVTWTLDKFNLTELLTKLLLQHSSPLIDVSLDVSSDAADRFALRLTPPVMQPLLRPGPARPSCPNVAADEIDLNEGYKKYLECTSDYSRYLLEVEAAIKALRLLPQLNTKELEQLVQEISMTIELDVWDKDLLDALPAAGEKRRQLVSKQYEKMTVHGLQDKYKMVDWRKLLSGLLRVSEAELPDTAEVQVYFGNYMDKLFTSLETKEPRTLHNALVAMYARDLYAHALVGGQRCQRKQRCLSVATELMGDVAASLYLASYTSAELDKMEAASQTVFVRLRTTLEQQLKVAAWLDAGSRSDAVAKLHRMRLDVTGGRHLFTNLTWLDQRIEEIDLNVSNDVIKLSVALIQRYRRQMYSLYDKNPNSTEAGWTHFLSPFKTSAISVYGLNSVMVPFGLLTWPLYDPAAPRHLTLARLGFVIAHEMAHHFDSVGIQYGAGGHGDSVLMPGAASRAFDFYMLVQCPVHGRYDYQATHAEPDGTVVRFNLDSAKLSRNERLADAAASALSLDAARRWQLETLADPTLADTPLPYLGLTPAKEHFLAVAQMFCTKSGVDAWRVTLFESEHPPNVLRVNDLVTNSADFSAAFTCPIGHEMSPTLRCDVFPALTKDEEDDAVTYDDSRIPVPS